MESRLSAALQMKYNPVAIIWTDDKPVDALQFQKGKWGCVMMLFAQSARGKTAVFNKETFACFGGGVGLGFGGQYENFMGGIECFYRFLSTGNLSWEKGQEVIKQARQDPHQEISENFLYGERYVKSPELVKKFVERLPIIDVPTKYVMFKPLIEVDEKKEEPVVIVFPVNPDQLSALIIMAHYAREQADNVYAPFGAGCQTIGILAYHEAKKEYPRAVIGMTDISARSFSSRQLGKNILTLAVPLKMFYEMDGNVEGSFLQKEGWLSLLKQNKDKE